MSSRPTPTVWPARAAGSTPPSTTCHERLTTLDPSPRDFFAVVPRPGATSFNTLHADDQEVRNAQQGPGPVTRPTA